MRTVNAFPADSPDMNDIADGYGNGEVVVEEEEFEVDLRMDEKKDMAFVESIRRGFLGMK